MSAIRYLKSLSPMMKISTPGENYINPIFSLCSNFTTVMLVVSSILLSATEFFGKPINCMSSLPKNVINSYCWVSKTFTMHDYSNRETGQQAVAPGVFSPESYDDDFIQDKWRFHNYYQWVVFFLCGMAFLTYLPKYLWNSWEGGLLKTVSLNLSTLLFKDNEVASKKEVILQYLKSHLKMHNSYAFKYWLCEVLCFVSLVTQMLLMDSFLNGEFRNYGLQVLNFTEMDQTERVDPMIFVFPRMTKCIFHLYGSSGTIERKDAFCLLTQNILNEKIFVLLWFWYIILSVLLGFLIIYRIILIALPTLRIKIMYHHSKVVSLETLQIISDNTSIGDWWLLYQMCGTVNPHILRDILDRLARSFSAKVSIRPGCSNQSVNGYHVNGHGGQNNGSDGLIMYPYFPNGNSHTASAPPQAAGFAQSSV